MEPILKQSVGGCVCTWHYSAETAATAGELSAVNAAAFDQYGNSLVQETALTPEADGRMALTVPAEATLTPQEWCRAHFTYTYDGQARTQDVWFHIARTDFDLPFHYDDLVKFQPDLADFAWAGDAKFAKQRETAIGELYARLLNAGRKPWTILNRSSLTQPLAWLWLSHIFATLVKSPEDLWWRRSEDARAKYEAAFSAINILESADADIAGQEARPIGRTRLKRG